MALNEAPKGEAAASGPAPGNSTSPEGAPSGLDRVAPWLAIAYVLGLLLVFVGERIVLGVDAARYALTGLGVALASAATVLRFLVAARADGERRGVERALAGFAALGLAGLAVYFATSTDAGKALLHIAKAAPDTRARVEGLSTIAWIVLLGVGVVPLLFGERALAPMRTAERIEARRVRSATMAGLTLAVAAVYTSLLAYAAGELELKADFSYYRTSRPSESTKNLAKNLTEPVKAMAFFPRFNDVGVEVEGYLRELGRAAPSIQVEVHDRLMVPALAKEAKVVQDGVVVLTRGSSREVVTIGADMKTAGTKLKALDTDVQKALLKVLREQRVAYLTVGHGELNESQTGDAAAEGRTARSFRKLLESQNYVVKDLGVGQGLGADVPSDAFLVVVLGPSKPFLPEEVAAIGRYAERGGKLFMALDPEAKIDLAPLAGTVDLTWQPTLLVTDDPRHQVARRHNASDKAILATNRFSSHASVSTLSRNSSRAFVVLPGVAPLDKKPQSDAKFDFTVKTFGETFVDIDGNYTFDAGSDKRGTWNVAAAVTRPAPGADKAGKPNELRAFVLGDVDSVADYLMSYDANLVLVLDAVRWLGGEESFAGAVTTAEDVRIEHTKQKDVIWFYATIFGAPALVLGLGLYATRRRGARASQQRRAA
jgi:hypothetical protein